MFNLFSKLAKNNSSSEKVATTVVSVTSAKKHDIPLKTRFFYRDLSGGWTESAQEIPVKNILLCSAESASIKCFCHLHRKFEDAEIKGDEVVFHCGAVSVKGAVMPFVEYTDEILLLKKDLRVAEKELDELNNRYLYDEDSEKEKLECKNKRDQIKEQVQVFEEKYLYKKGEMNSDVFEIKLYEYADADKLDFVFVEFDREKFYEKLPYRFNENFFKETIVGLKKHDKPTYLDNDINFFDNHKDVPVLYGKYYLPSNLQTMVMDRMWDQINNLVGRKIKFNTTLSGLELMNSARFFPYEPNVYYLRDFYFHGDELEKLNKSISQTDTDLVKTICGVFGTRSYRTLRKYFVEEPAVLYFYIKFYELGFRDKNFFNYLFKEIKALGLTEKFSEIEKRGEKIYSFRDQKWILSLNIFFYGIMDRQYYNYQYQYSYINVLKFFCDVSLPLRGEKATYLALAKNKVLDKNTAFDTLRMFEQAYEFLTESEKKKILQEGCTRYNHDMLVKIINHNKNKNFEFTLTKEQLSLEDDVDVYTFRLPKDYYSLLDLGSIMHNCVASYKDMVIDKTSTIVSAAKNDDFCACIEIRDGKRVVQNLGKHNNKLGHEVAAVVSKWMEKHELIDDT